MAELRSRAQLAHEWGVSLSTVKRLTARAVPDGGEARRVGPLGRRRGGHVGRSAARWPPVALRHPVPGEPGRPAGHPCPGGWPLGRCAPRIKLGSGPRVDGFPCVDRAAGFAGSRERDGHHRPESAAGRVGVLVFWDPGPIPLVLPAESVVGGGVRAHRWWGLVLERWSVRDARLPGRCCPLLARDPFALSRAMAGAPQSSPIEASHNGTWVRPRAARVVTRSRERQFRWLGWAASQRVASMLAPRPA
jgi:hypothetical protein